MHGCCCNERVNYGCMAAAAINAWICELWMRGYVSYGCVSYGYVRVDVVAMNAWKHGSMEIWKHECVDA